MTKNAFLACIFFKICMRRRNFGQKKFFFTALGELGKSPIWSTLEKKFGKIFNFLWKYAPALRPPENLRSGPATMCKIWRNFVIGCELNFFLFLFSPQSQVLFSIIRMDGKIHRLMKSLNRVNFAEIKWKNPVLPFINAFWIFEFGFQYKFIFCTGEWKKIAYLLSIK